MVNIISPKSDISDFTLINHHEDEDDFFSLVEQAKKVDHQIYTYDRLKEASFKESCDSPGITGVIVAPYKFVKAIIHFLKNERNAVEKHLKALYNMLLSPTEFLRAVAELLITITRMQLLVISAVCIVTLSTVAGGVFSGIAIIYDTIKIIGQIKFQNTFTFSEREIPESLVDTFSSKTKDEFVSKSEKAIEDFQQIKEKFVNKYSVEEHSRILFLLNRHRALVTKRSDSQFHAIFNSFQEKISHPLKKIMDTHLEQIDSYLKLSENTEKLIDDYAKNQLEKNSDITEALNNTLTKIQKEHSRNKTKILAYVPTHAVMQYTLIEKNLKTCLTSSDTKMNIEGIKHARSIFKSFERGAKDKLNAYCFSLVIHALFLTAIVLSQGLVSCLPTILYISAGLLSTFHMITVKGYCNSPDGKFHFSNILPDFMKKPYFYAKKKLGGEEYDELAEIKRKSNFINLSNFVQLSKAR